MQPQKQQYGGLEVETGIIHPVVMIAEAVHPDKCPGAKGGIF